jgi:hypothetical protein
LLQWNELAEFEIVQELFCGQTRAWGYEYALAEMLMMYSQILTSALEIVRD